MTKLLDKIDQISIYLKTKENDEERVNEIALFSPLARQDEPKEASKILHQRQWTLDQSLGPKRRFFLKIQTFFLKNIKSLISPDRKTNEAKFKTVLAILLVQEELRSCFFKQQKTFLNAVQETAHLSGYQEFVLPAIDKSHTPLAICRKLTRLHGKKKSLIDDIAELQLQIATLCEHERDQILFSLLSRVTRPPIRSVLEVTKNERLPSENIEITTLFGKVVVYALDPKTGRVDCTVTPDKATSSIQVKEQKTHSVMNQRVAIDVSTKNLIGGYCGALLTDNNVLEQLIFVLGLQKEVYSLSCAQYSGETLPKTILFTSLFSWTEARKIASQYHAIWQLNGKVITGLDKDRQKKAYKLHLLYHNIPFNAAGKYPSPKEIGAHLEDDNEECLIALTFETLQMLQQQKKDLYFFEDVFPTLVDIDKRLRSLRSHQMSEKSDNISDTFLQREKVRLNLIDQFKPLKKQLIKKLESLENTSSVVLSLMALLSKKSSKGHPLSHIDEYIYTTELAKGLNFLHNTNCFYSTDRSAGAVAADKGQYVFSKLCGRPYLPAEGSKEDQELFKVLYSLYLVFEEPEITTALSTGFMGEKFHKNVLIRNPETTKYLMPWIKKNPQIYLGLSHYRT